jgi:MOSC domain-containing protein YiiM
MSAPRSILTLTRDLNTQTLRSEGSLVWIKASHQSSTKSHIQRGNKLYEAEKRELSGCKEQYRKNMKAYILAVSISEKKGVKKDNIPEGLLIENFGLKDDAHAGDWHRQISLLAMESIEKIKAKGLDVGPGDFAENITTIGIDLVNLPIGTRLKIGDEALVEVTQIGKECHARCAIYHQTGDCVMPKEGIFVKVLKGGKVKKGDQIARIDS